MPSTADLSGRTNPRKLAKRPRSNQTIDIEGRKTSVSLEPEFWAAVRDLAHSRQQTIADLVTEIDKTRDNANLSSAIRLFVLAQAQSGNVP
jgi:predicted DNA-binding ribbon-helix-helix protein